MKLRFDLVLEYCEKTFAVTASHAADTQVEFSLPRFYEGGSALDADGFYVVDNQKGAALVPVKGLALYVDRVAARRSRASSCYIALDGSVDAKAVMNGILAFAQTLGNWVDRSIAAARTGSMQDLLDLANPVLGFPLFYTNATLRKTLYAMTPEEDALAERTITTHKSFRERALSLADVISVDAEFVERTVKTEAVFTYQLPANMAPDQREIVVAYPLPANRGGGIVAGVSFEGKATALQCWGMQRLGEFLVMNMSLSSAAYGDDAIRSALKLLVEGLPYVDDGTGVREMLHKRLPPIMACGVFRHEGSDEADDIAVVRCARIETVIPDCIAFEYADKVVAVMPADFAYDENGKVSARIVGAATECHERIGLSNVVKSTLDLRMGYIEALRASQIDSVLHKGQQVTPFGDCLIDYIARYGMTELGKRSLCGPQFFRLVHHDTNSSTKYLDTLKTFFSCGTNVSETAKCLGIHRSTLLARLERIGQLSGTDFSNYEDCAALYIRLRLYQQKKA